jgi:hypothetical protein
MKIYIHFYAYLAKYLSGRKIFKTEGVGLDETLSIVSNFRTSAINNGLNYSISVKKKKHKKVDI